MAPNSIFTTLDQLDQANDKVDQATHIRNLFKDEAIALLKADDLKDSKFDLAERTYVLTDKESRSLTLTYLKKILQEYFSDDLTTSLELYDFILDNRPVQVKETLVTTKKPSSNKRKRT